MYHQAEPTTSTPATSAQAAEALQVLFDSMRFPPGVDEKRAIFGYMTALNGFSVEAIEAGIRKFLRGECEGVNPKYCPHPPELAFIVRTAVVPERVFVKQLAPPERPQWGAGERDRMRLKMPMWRHAFECGRVDELDTANRAGFGAMVVLAGKWGIPIPDELLADEGKTEREWRLAGNRARAAIEANPPPFMRRFEQAI